MPKKVEAMTAIQIPRLTKPGAYAVGTVPGLYLVVGKGTARSWILRYMDGNKRVEHGLGGYPEVTLAKAWEKARDVKEGLGKGLKPVLRIGKRKLVKAPTFRTAAADYIAMRTVEWSNPKHAQQWTNTLETYAYPSIGDLPVDQITRNHVLALLTPIWNTKNETATRVRSRVENVLDWAKVKGYRSGDNPAEWKGNLQALLANPSKVAPVENHAAIDWRELPGFMTALRTVDSMSARCLEFTILTAVRSGEARGAAWTEIDLDAARWTIPAARMKAKREHVVPLSADAVKLLRALPRIADNLLVFPSPAAGGMLSDVAVAKTMRNITPGITVHGFRSAFRDWAAEATDTPNEVAEMALAHAIGDAVEAAYRRGDLLTKRTLLMSQWAQYCAKPTTSVTSLPARPASAI
jgi:integrase